MPEYDEYYEHFYDEFRDDYGDSEHTKDLAHEEAMRMVREDTARAEAEADRIRSIAEIESEEYKRLSNTQAALPSNSTPNSSESSYIAIATLLAPLVVWGCQKLGDWWENRNDPEPQTTQDAILQDNITKELQKWQKQPTTVRYTGSALQRAQVEKNKEFQRQQNRI